MREPLVVDIFRSLLSVNLHSRLSQKGVKTPQKWQKVIEELVTRYEAPISKQSNVTKCESACFDPDDEDFQRRRYWIYSLSNDRNVSYQKGEPASSSAHACMFSK